MSVHLNLFFLLLKGEDMIKIYEGKLPDIEIVRTINGKKRIIKIPLDSMCTIYEQSGQTYYCVNNSTRKLLPTA